MENNITKDTRIPLIVQKYIDEVTQKYSKNVVQLKIKDDSKLMKAIGWILKKTRINPFFMERYITTIGNTIYYPKKLLETENPIDILEVISHESIHIRDFNRFGLLYNLSYLSPQILALLSTFSLLAFTGNKSWLFCLLFLLFLAPIPSFGRYFWERRAYRTMFIFLKNYFHCDENYIKEVRESIASQLTGNYYYFTWPFSKIVIKDLSDNSFMEEPEYKDITNFINKNLLS